MSFDLALSIFSLVVASGTLTFSIKMYLAPRYVDGRTVKSIWFWQSKAFLEDGWTVSRDFSITDLLWPTAIKSESSDFSEDGEEG